jgi:hypothetical protein
VRHVEHPVLDAVVGIPILLAVAAMLLLWTVSERIVTGRWRDQT